jgi:hypothetical protein
LWKCPYYEFHVNPSKSDIEKRDLTKRTKKVIKEVVNKTIGKACLQSSNDSVMLNETQVIVLDPLDDLLENSESSNLMGTSDINVPWMNLWFLIHSLGTVFSHFESDVKYMEFWMVFRRFLERNRNDHFSKIVKQIVEGRCTVFPYSSVEHWVLLFEMDSCLCFIDSFNKPIETYSELNEFIVYFKRTVGGIEYQQFQVEQQKDFCTCGHRVLLYSLMIYHRIQPSFLSSIHFKRRYFEVIAEFYEQFKNYSTSGYNRSVQPNNSQFNETEFNQRYADELKRIATEIERSVPH